MPCISRFEGASPRTEVDNVEVEELDETVTIVLDWESEAVIVTVSVSGTALLTVLCWWLSKPCTQEAKQNAWGIIM